MAIPVEQQGLIIERIRYLIARLGLSQAGFARRLGISAANMSKHLSGRLPITQGLVNRICLDCNVSRKWLLSGDDVPFAKPEAVKETGAAFAPRGVPVYDIDVTAGFGPLERVLTEDRISGYVSLPGLHGDDGGMRLVRVSGDSMEPAVRNGSYIAISTLSDNTIFWGRIYVIVTDSHRMVKTVRPHPSDPERLVLHSENHAYDDMVVPLKDIVGLYKVDAVINFTNTDL